MTSTRPYRPGRTLEQAIDEMRRCAGTQFDRRCVDAFIAILQRDAEPPVTAPPQNLAAAG
jgi:HD-GYP domain-containing protein (c-di-GMP phosphodiesterase class II)